MSVFLKVLAIVGAGLISYFFIANWIDYLIFKFAMTVAGYRVDEVFGLLPWRVPRAASPDVSVVLVILRPIVSTLIVFGGGAVVIALLGVRSWAAFGAFAYFFFLTQDICLVGRRYSLKAAGWAMVITMAAVIIVYSYSSLGTQQAIQTGGNISEHQYARLVQHVRDVGPVRIHWYSQTLEPRRLIAYGFGTDSLVVDTWFPIVADTVHWSDLHLERVHLVDVGCDGVVDRTAILPVGGAPTELLTDAADSLWQVILYVAYEFSDFEGGCPLSVMLPTNYDSSWSDLSPEEELDFLQVIGKAFDEEIDDRDLARLEHSMRSYITRADPRMAFWQIDVMDLMVETVFRYKVELGRCLLQSIDLGRPYISTELERLQMIQQRFGFGDNETFEADRVKLAISASRAPYQGPDMQWYEPPTRAEILASMKATQQAEANFLKISALLTRLIDEYSETPAPAREDLQSLEG